MWGGGHRREGEGSKAELPRNMKESWLKKWNEENRRYGVVDTAGKMGEARPKWTRPTKG